MATSIQNLKGLNLHSESETGSDYVGDLIQEVIEEQKRQKQSQITDFFPNLKIIFS